MHMRIDAPSKQYGRDAGRGGGATGFGNGVPSFFPRVTIRRHSVNLTSAPADGNLLPEGAHMAIIGIGLDLIELSRMERSLHRFGEHFLNRIMADDERSAIPGDPASPVRTRRFPCGRAVRRQGGRGQGAWYGLR